MTTKRLTPIVHQEPDYKSMVVMEFNEDEIPFFSQGFDGHELTTVVTAERCQWMVNELVRLRKLLTDNNIAC